MQTRIRAVLSAVFLLVTFWLVARNFDHRQFLDSLSALSGSTLLTICLFLLVSSAFAALRLRVIATSFGYELSLRESVAVLGLGQLGGALFFQIFGQLMARGSYLARQGVPFAGTVLITFQERVSAALVSFGMAVAGALYLFRHVTLDLVAGGADLVRLVCGLAVAFGIAAWIWRAPLTAALARITRVDLARAIYGVLFSAAVQLSMMAAYVTAARALAPAIALDELIAAVALVMFAASIPVSLAGWGIREMSAVAALGAIGMNPGSAVLVAIAIGALSILCAIILSLSALRSAGTVAARDAAAATEAGIHRAALEAVLPVLTATLVFFQVHIPTEASTLNVNLADPIAIVAGVLAVLTARHHAPVWRLSGLNLHILAATAVMTLGLLIGAADVGWTQWAVTNKWLGWFVLLAYGAAGALAARLDLAQVLRTFSAVGSAIVLFELVGAFAAVVGLATPAAAAGFAQNPNAFAFQCLMLLCIALAHTGGFFSAVVTLALVGIWLSGSRAGIGAAAITAVFALIVVPKARRGLLTSALIAIAVSGALTILPWMLATATGEPPAVLPPSGYAMRVANSASSNAAHFQSMIDGLRLFLSHPVFGAGLGVFIAHWQGPFPLAIHSSALWLLAEFGLVGAALLIWPAVRMFFAEMPHPRDTAGRLIVLIITAFSAMSVFHELLYQRTLWFLLGAALAVPRLARH